MPELPEVETVRSVLLNQVVNTCIQKIQILYPKIVASDYKTFENKIVSHAIVDIKRRGKFLIFILDDQNSFIAHMRMEGKFFYEKSGSIRNKHVHVIFEFANGYELVYQDVRKFGRLEYKTQEELYKTKPLLGLGFEPFETNGEYLFKKLSTKHIPIKTALLDQRIILGLGNIYVDEVLFYARIMPNRVSSSITLVECQEILTGAKEILQKAIECKGTTIRSYTSSLGVTGKYQEFLKIHTKSNCSCCKDKIFKMKIGGRTTYYCPNCQR